MFGATCRSTPAIGSQHKAGLARLGQIAHAVQKAGKGHHYLNVRVVLCGSPRLASRIRREKAAIIFDPTARREQVSHYTRMNPGALAQETRNKYPHLSRDPPQLDIASRINQVKNALAKAFLETATPTKPHNPPTRLHNQSVRNHPQNQIER